MGQLDLDRVYDPPTQPGAGPAEQAAELTLLRRWERLRILYNLILAAVVLLLGARSLGEPGFLRWLVARAFAANVLYCVGPIANAYAHWLGLRHVAVTTALFVLGTMLAVLLAAVSVNAFGLGRFD